MPAVDLLGSDAAETLCGFAGNDRIGGGAGDSSRVQFLAQYLTQCADRHRRIVLCKGRA